MLNQFARIFNTYQPRQCKDGYQPWVYAYRWKCESTVLGWGAPSLAHTDNNIVNVMWSILTPNNCICPNMVRLDHGSVRTVKLNWEPELATAAGFAIPNRTRTSRGSGRFRLLISEHGTISSDSELAVPDYEPSFFVRKEPFGLWAGGYIIFFLVRAERPY